MLDSILVAVDGSECAQQGARLALSLAQAADTPVEVLHVTPPEADGGRADSILAEVAEMATESHPAVTCQTRTGKPATEIVSYADEADVDMVMVGRRGQHGVADRLLGSVAHSVLRRSERPVLTVPADGVSDAIDSVLVTTDGSDAAEWAAPYGATLAAQVDATVHACNVVDVAYEAGPFSAGGVTQDVIAQYENRGQEAVDRLVDLLRDSDPDLPVETAVVRGRPHGGIVTYVDDNDIDLVVMSSVGESSVVGQLLGSVTDRVLRSVDVPVLVVTSAPGES